jgi:hypothetical protein
VQKRGFTVFTLIICMRKLGIFCPLLVCAGAFCVGRAPLA